MQIEVARCSCCGGESFRVVLGLIPGVDPRHVARVFLECLGCGQHASHGRGYMTDTERRAADRMLGGIEPEAAAPADPDGGGLPSCRCRPATVPGPVRWCERCAGGRP